MKQKTKLVVTVVAMCLVLTLGVFGILAVKTLNMSVGGNITFNASGINATISQGTLSSTGSWVTAGDADAKLKEVKVTTDKTETQINSELATWQGLNLQFNKNADDVTITFTITNNSASELLSISTSVTVATSKNARATIFPSSTILNSNKSQQFVITFSVDDKTINARLQEFEIVVGLNPEKQEIFESSNYPYLKFEYDTTNYTASVSANSFSYTGDVNIPPYVYNGGRLYTVNEIAEFGFTAYDLVEDEGVGMTMNTLTIPNTVTKIGQGAFCHCTITSETFTIPASVEEIEYIGFAYCNVDTLILESTAAPDWMRARNVVFGENIKALPDFFWDGGYISGFESLEIPNHITKIGFQVFTYCVWLKTLKIGSGVVEYDSSSFLGCPIEDLTIASQAVVDELTSATSAEIIKTAKTIKIRADLTPTAYLNSLTNGGTTTIDGEVYNIYTK